MPDPVIPRTAALDLVIAGAARSGTSFLAAQLSAHPGVDPGSVKEPNFFSRNYERGPGWFNGLFEPRSDALLRLDASVSYTYPQYPSALPRLAADSPDTYVIYIVRDPVPRAVSHYLFYRHYFKQESAVSFSDALASNNLYAGASDYRRWLEELYATFPRERVLVVPFRAVTAAGADVVTQVSADVGLPPRPDLVASAAAHQNNVVTFRHPALRFASRKLRRSRLYPVVRDRLGAARMRQVRSLATKNASLPTAAQALATCTADQLDQLRELEKRSDLAVTQALREQDARLGLSWSEHWTTPNALRHDLTERP